MATVTQDALQRLLSKALEGIGSNDHKPEISSNGLSGLRGVAVGAGAAALVPLAAKGAGKAAKMLAMNGLNGLANAPKDALGDFTSKLGDSVGGGIGQKVSEKVDEAGGASGILKSALPFGGDDDDEDDEGSGIPGVGQGRRMPVQQSIDIGLPIETVYDQWTQFEEWPKFMHRVTRVTQEDDCTVSFATKIWGKTKEFTAEIETQRPNERIKWRVTDGMTHTGVVTFHELGPRLTRVMLGMDVEPGSLLEKAARGMRHVKRAARADLHRFKAFIEMEEEATGGWKGVIEDGKVVKGASKSGSRRGTRRSSPNGRAKASSKSSSSKSARSSGSGSKSARGSGGASKSARSSGGSSRPRGRSRRSSPGHQEGSSQSSRRSRG